LKKSEKEKCEKECKRNAEEKGSSGNEFPEYDNFLLLKGKAKLYKILKLPPKRPAKSSF